MLLNFSPFLFQSPTLRKRFSIVLCSFSCFRFRLVFLVRLYPPRQLSQNGTHCYKTNRNFFTLAAVAKRFSANHFQVISPGAIAKIKKKMSCLDQSQFNNFAPYIILNNVKDVPVSFISSVPSHFSGSRNFELNVMQRKTGKILQSDIQ